jgi:hypothetical protein
MGSLADYQLLQVLGEGAFGIVRRVREVGSGREYALKMIAKLVWLLTNSKEHGTVGNRQEQGGGGADDAASPSPHR